MACLFLRSTLTPVCGGLMSEWHWTQLTGAENQRNGKSLHACIKRKKTYPAVASYSMPHNRLSAAWTRSFAMSEFRLDSAKTETLCAHMGGQVREVGFVRNTITS